MKKRIMCLLLAVVVAASLLAGCGKTETTGKKQNDKIRISMYLWDRS